MAGFDPLDVIRVRKLSRDEADKAWRDAIIAAHKAGRTSREIAEAAGLTHEGVRGILKKAEAK